MSLDGASIKIVDSNAKIEKNILYAMEKDVKFAIQKAKAKIHSGIINLVVEALSSSPEIMSLSNGKLKADFGLSSDPSQEIIYAVANSTEVLFRDFRMSRQGVSTVLSVYIQPSDFSNTQFVFYTHQGTTICPTTPSLPSLPPLLPLPRPDEGWKLE